MPASRRRHSRADADLGLPPSENTITGATPCHASRMPAASRSPPAREHRHRVDAAGWVGRRPHEHPAAGRGGEHGEGDQAHEQQPHPGTAPPSRLGRPGAAVVVMVHLPVNVGGGSMSGPGRVMA
jgi:hypothetical protein